MPGQEDAEFQRWLRRKIFDMTVQRRRVERAFETLLNSGVASIPPAPPGSLLAQAQTDAVMRYRHHAKTQRRLQVAAGSDGRMLSVDAWYRRSCARRPHNKAPES